MDGSDNLSSCNDDLHFDREDTLSQHSSMVLAQLLDSVLQCCGFLYTYQMSKSSPVIHRLPIGIWRTLWNMYGHVNGALVGRANCASWTRGHGAAKGTFVACLYEEWDGEPLKYNRDSQCTTWKTF